MPENKETNIYLYKILDGIILLSLLAFSFCFNFKAGERGFFPLDQSIFFDGGYRIISGQIPYKDFYSPFGPMSFWLQAFFFKLLGVNYFAYIFSASFINLLVTLCSIIILRLLFPSRIFISYLAGLLTAIWFYPPFGTTSSEHTAIFFALVAILFLLLVLIKKNINSIAANLLLFLSGCLVFVSFISKQSIVVLFPLFFLLTAIADAPNLKRLLQKWVVFSAGFLAGLSTFILWLYFNSDIKAFIYHFFTIPNQMAKGRFLYLLKTFYCFNTLGPPCVKHTFSLSSFIFIGTFIMLVSNFIKFKDEYRRYFIVCTLGIYFVLFQNSFIYLTGNNIEMSFTLIGITFALGIGIAFELATKIYLKITVTEKEFIPCNTKIFKIMLISVACILSVFLSRRGIIIALSRIVQDIIPEGARFPKYMTIKKLENLRWAQPTMIMVNSVDVKEDDLVNLYAYLKEKDKNFFIFTDFTIFYGLLDKPSPQPLLWFHKGRTYPLSQYDPNLDKRIVDDLRKNNVEIIIIETVSFLEIHKPVGVKLSSFPQLESYIFKNFTKKKQIGIFSIYEKTPYS